VHPRPGVRVALAMSLALLWALLLAGVAASLRYGFHGSARAGYLLAGMAPGALVTALGLDAADRWLERRGGTAARAVLYGWLAALAAASAATFAS